MKDNSILSVKIWYDFEKFYNSLPIEEVVSNFETFTNQEVPAFAMRDFRFSGLTNIDFLTSDFLNRHGLKNILQFLNDK